MENTMLNPTISAIPAIPDIDLLSASNPLDRISFLNSQEVHPRDSITDSSPEGAGTKIRNLFTLLYGTMIYDPAFTAPRDVTIYNTQRTPMANCLEILIAYDPGQGPKLKVYDWGIRLNKPGEKCFFDYGSVDLFPQFTGHVTDTPVGQMPCIWFLNGYSRSNNRQEIWLWDNEGKWQRIYTSSYNCGSPTIGSEGYSQIEAWFPSGTTAPRLNKPIAARALKGEVQQGQFVDLSSSNSIHVVDSYFLSYRTLFSEDDMANWGYISR